MGTLSHAFFGGSLFLRRDLVKRPKRRPVRREGFDPLDSLTTGTFPVFSASLAAAKALRALADISKITAGDLVLISAAST
nr:hypothetical protein [uncultured bacterium]